MLQKRLTMVPTLYKYLRYDYADRMMSEGEVYVGTLAYYRGIEDPTRADLNEGKKDSITHFPDAVQVVSADDWQEHLGFLKGSNIKYAGGTVQIESGTRFIAN